MSHSLSDLLLRYAQQMEDQHAPQNMTIALREAARELDRLRAGGCALPSDGRAEGLVKASELFALSADRDRLTAEVERLNSELLQRDMTWLPAKDAEIERLRAALEKMQRSRDRYRQAWEDEKARAALAQEKAHDL